MTRNAVWALSNLCRGKNPPPDFTKVAPALEVLARLLFHNDFDVLADTCWALRLVKLNQCDHESLNYSMIICPFTKLIFNVSLHSIFYVKLPVRWPK